MKKFIIFGLILLLVAGASVWYIFNGGKSEDSNNESTTTSQDVSASKESPSEGVASIIESRSSLDTMYSQLEAAGLVETLNGAEQYTVFAVTDKAFENTDESVMAAIKSPENDANLKRVMQYHIVKGTLTLEQVKQVAKIPTILGQELLVESKEDQVYIIDAKGQKGQLGISDIKASNGVVHEINLLLLPQ
jgi:uncharacterized surface protein with fasciclin (FAS1) repeats